MGNDTWVSHLEAGHFINAPESDDGVTARLVSLPLINRPGLMCIVIAIFTVPPRKKVPKTWLGAD